MIKPDGDDPLINESLPNKSAFQAPDAPLLRVLSQLAKLALLPEIPLTIKGNAETVVYRASH